MVLITSAGYVTPALASEFGKLPPCMLPVQNRRLYEHQISILPKEENIVISLPQSYLVTLYDKERLYNLGVTVIKVPDYLSLGQSIVYVLNVLGNYNETISILHGDTLFSSLVSYADVCAIATAEDNYDWDSVNLNDETVYAGYFSFSNPSLLIKCITENDYDFIKGIEAYKKLINVADVVLPHWMDFGLSNSYYRSISKMTTQRVFNSMQVTRYSVIKSSKDKRKMIAESNWLSSLPTKLKHYVPAVWDKGENNEYGYYEIEYYFLSSLANLFVFGKNKPYVWKEIINACVEYLNDEYNFKPDNLEFYALKNDQLYTKKTYQRLQKYSQETGISLEKEWIINGIHIQSINGILNEIDSYIGKKDTRFVTIMHGDPGFSNILYDFKSKSIKVIDPRGLDLDGNISIFGDFRYDVAKLAHSVIGMYDFIIGGMFNYYENSSYDVILNFEVSDELRSIQEYFCRQKFAGYSISELSTYPILIHLFFSMLPLHNDYPTRQKAMLANALKLYVEFKNIK